MNLQVIWAEDHHHVNLSQLSLPQEIGKETRKKETL